jgi:hypothetical protein
VSPTSDPSTGGQAPKAAVRAGWKLTETQRIDVVQRYIAGQSLTRLAATFGVSRPAVAGLLRRRGISIRPQAKLTDEQRREAVGRYIRGETSTRIAADFGVSGVAICDLLHRRRVAVRRKCTVRHDALDEIKPESAYWCGFLFADGNVYAYRNSNQQPVPSLGVAERDRGQLIKLRTFLGSTHKIQEVSGRFPSCQFRVASTRLAERLCELGRYEGPLAPELVASRHFWRGLVDGDGSIGCYPKRPGAVPSPQFRVYGEQRMLLAFISFLRMDGTTGANLSVRPHKSIYIIGTTGQTAVRIMELLYEDAPVALDRKADAVRLIIAKHRAGPTTPVTALVPLGGGRQISSSATQPISGKSRRG